jgi:hypothetical protein
LLANHILLFYIEEIFFLISMKVFWQNDVFNFSLVIGLKKGVFFEGLLYFPILSTITVNGKEIL